MNTHEHFERTFRALHDGAPAVTTIAPTLAAASALLNARNWDAVFDGIPAWHPRNETPAATEGETVDDGSGILEAAGVTEPAAEPETPAGPEGEPEPDRLMSAFEQFRDDFTRRVEGIETRLPQPAESPQPEEPSVEDLLNGIIRDLGDEHFTEDGELTPEGNAAAMFQMAQQAVDRALAPERQQREIERIERGAEELEKKYPALQNEQFQDQILDATKEFCDALGVPHLAVEPAMVERVLLAHLGQQRAASETPASGQPDVRLQRGTSAGPAGDTASPDDELGDSIVNLARSQHFRLGRQ